MIYNTKWNRFIYIILLHFQFLSGTETVVIKWVCRLIIRCPHSKTILGGTIYNNSFKNDNLICYCKNIDRWWQKLLSKFPNATRIHVPIPDLIFRTKKRISDWIWPVSSILESGDEIERKRVGWESDAS